MTSAKPCRLLALATQGTGGDDEARLRVLLTHCGAEFFPFHKTSKRRSFCQLLRTLWHTRPDLVIMEGTGVAGGVALLLARWLMGTRYVVSSGDAVGPFVALHRPWLGPLFGLYERLLCRWCAGFIGWTPYLTGRALTYGAPRAATAAGWAPYPRTPTELAAGRARIRAQLGIADETLVIGLVGSLAWNRRVRYCYGAELVRAVRRLERRDVRALIVGAGDGCGQLEHLAGDELGQRILLTGRVPRDTVPDYLAAMDLASLPQSLDQVGHFRYTTKLSEYLAAGLPVVTGQLPLAYDLDGGWLWRLPGRAPWDEVYLDALAKLLAHLTPAELLARRTAVPRELPEFDRARQVARVTALVTELLA